MNCLRSLIVLTLLASMASAEETFLTDTVPLTLPPDQLPDILMDGAHRFVDRKINEVAKDRSAHWPTANADPSEWVAATSKNRSHLAEILGVVDSRVPPAMESFHQPGDPPDVYADSHIRISQVRWPVLPGVFGEGLLATPTGDIAASLILIPNTDQTPEQLLGLTPGCPEATQFSRKLLASGVQILIPTLVSREMHLSDNERVVQSNQTHREWLYRQAFHMGRHVIGYEVQIALAGVDWFTANKPYQNHRNNPVAVAGYGDGGLVAFYAAALDPRIDATLISGYFDARDRVWSEPIDRNIWSLLTRFSDVEVASLILPRRLIVEYSEIPDVTNQKGDLATPPFPRVHAEWKRIITPAGTPEPALITGELNSACQPYSPPAAEAFLAALEVEPSEAVVGLLADSRTSFSSDARQQRLVMQIERHVQQLVDRSEHVREQFFLGSVAPDLLAGGWTTDRRVPTHSEAGFIEGSKAFRKRFSEQAIGRFQDPLLPFNTRTRVVAETDAWTAHDVVLDVHRDLIAWGVLVLPKDLKPGERRPVVVCQHGRNGVPRDTIDAGTTAYNDFAGKLAERGFITFAPHNLYRGEDRYRWLDRKANTIGCTLFSFIVSQHDQILRWLNSQPFVASDRIAFYGLSYGGETAVRVPTILEDYCLSICSGDFNQWTRKVASTDQPFSFMNTIEWEMPYWNLGHTFDYAEMTYLMFPRPFMAERGHHDRVGRDHWVAHEFAKVRWLYAQFEKADRVEIEFFQGGHSINGEGSFAFLHHHLNWPLPSAEAH